MKSLYFIAIEPHPELIADIKKIQLDFAERFQSVKAFRSFPHITLIPPFSLDDTQESACIQEFQKIKIGLQSFVVNLKGFGSFPKQNGSVVFIRPLYQPNLLLLREKFKGFSTSIFLPDYHPHLTVAFRDLSFENYQKAWEEYQNKAFSASFSVQEVGLYKHIEGKWKKISGLRL